MNSLCIFTLFSPSEVRGMMYFRQALELQAFLDMAKDEGTWRKIHWEGERVGGWGRSLTYFAASLNLFISIHKQN